MAGSGLFDRRAGRVAGIVQIFLDRAQQAVGKAGAPVLAGRLARRVGCSDLLEAARQRIELRRHVARFCLDGGTLILAFGLCFQLPVVMTLLGLAGLINSQMMAKGRRYAIVAVVVVAAVVTPPDPISQLMLAVPMVLLYEVSIWCVRIIELRRKKADAADGLAA